MVPKEGLEPPTLWFEARYSIQLSHLGTRSLLTLSETNFNRNKRKWCLRQESNLRPFGPQPNTLSTELRRQILLKELNHFSRNAKGKARIIFFAHTLPHLLPLHQRKKHDFLLESKLPEEYQVPRYIFRVTKPRNSFPLVQEFVLAKEESFR